MAKLFGVLLALLLCLPIAASAQIPVGSSPAPGASPGGIAAVPAAQQWAWIAAVAGVAFTIWSGLSELAANRRQRKDELSWKRAEVAKSLNDDVIKDRLANAALLMIDFPLGRPYKLRGGEVQIDRGAVLGALTFREVRGGPVMSDLDRFIRDSFDTLLYRWGFFEHYVSRKLVEFEDVEQPARYYVDRVRETALHNVLGSYISAYRFELAEAFLVRFYKKRLEGRPHSGA